MHLLLVKWLQWKKNQSLHFQKDPLQYYTASQKNLKRQKNSWNQIEQIFFSWNCISGSFKLFPSSKMDFWPFLKLQKMECGQKIFCEIDLFDFTSFFDLDFFNFSGQLWEGRGVWDDNERVCTPLICWPKDLVGFFHNQFELVWENVQVYVLQDRMDWS